MKKNDAYITMDSFGSELPENWQEIADLLNEKIEQLEEDEYGEIDRDDVDAIWENYWKYAI